jgi:hypothetical protein
MTLRGSAGPNMTRRALALIWLIVGVACIFQPCVGWTTISADYSRKFGDVRAV